jgi:nucleotide-binding universal stress UspA family protein
VHPPVGDAVAGRWAPREAERYLMKLQSNAAWVRARLRVDAGDPTERILAVQREEGADLVAMVQQSMGAVARFFLGSTTQNVLQKIPTPMLVARHGLTRTPVRLKRIAVLGSGGSDLRAAIDPLRRLALRLRAEVIVLRVGEDVDPAFRELEHLLPGVRSADLGRPSDPGEAVLERARSEEADLLALPFPRGARRDAAVEAALRNSPVPLLLLPNGKP